MAKKSARGGKQAGKKKPGGRRGTDRPRAVRQTVTKVREVANRVGGSVAKAVKNFSANLGAMKIDKGAAPDQLEELGTLLEDVAGAKATADEKAETAKTAKATYESKVNLLLEKLRGFTHPKALPLFDGPAREADQKTMLDAIDGGLKDGTTGAEV